MRGQLAEAGGKEISMGDRLKASTGLMKLFEDRREDAAAGDREGNFISGYPDRDNHLIDI